MPPATEARHPIGVVSERTGLTPDVLRAWERRHRVVDPKRSPGGQRIYSDADIERLTLLHRATQSGHGIRHVAGLSRSKLQDLLRDIESSEVPLPGRFNPAGEPNVGQPNVGQPNAAVKRSIEFTEALNPSGLETLLRRSVARYGIVTFLDVIAAPFLREVGDAWHGGRLSVSQEHIATAVVQRVVSETAPLLTGADENPTIVVATLEGERHANGALMAAATAASEGWRVIYLGADLPAKEIAETAVRTGARAVGISIVLPRKRTRLAAEIRELERAMPEGATLLVGGAGAKILKQSTGGTAIVFIESMSELHTELVSIRDKL